jgi:hypothetical protein
MSDETNRKELTARLDSDLYEQLREVTYHLRISKQQAITEALRMWLQSISIGEAHPPSPDTDVPADMLPVVNWLVRLWGHKGTPEQEGLKNSLKALAASSETERKGQSRRAPQTGG